MGKVKLTITESNCRCGYVKAGDTFVDGMDASTGTVQFR